MNIFNADNQPLISGTLANKVNLEFSAVSQ